MALTLVRPNGAYVYMYVALIDPFMKFEYISNVKLHLKTRSENINIQL